MKILVLQGPNLNLLGSREQDIYGKATLAQITDRLDRVAEELGLDLVHVQSNSEGTLVDAVQDAAREGMHGVLVNAAAYSHTSIALRDALVGTRLPFVEVHLSNLFARKDYRQKSMLADASVGLVMGFGPVGYELALRGLVARLRGP